MPALPPESPRLLTDDEWRTALREYTLGSFPLGWEPAKQRLCGDRVARTALMTSTDDKTHEQLHAEALDYELDHVEEDMQELLRLLIKVHKGMPTGPLRDEVNTTLEKFR